MPIIKIDEKEYESDNLSAIVKEQLQSLQFVDNEMNVSGPQTTPLSVRGEFSNACVHL